MKYMLLSLKIIIIVVQKTVCRCTGTLSAKVLSCVLFFSSCVLMIIWSHQHKLYVVYNNMLDVNVMHCHFAQAFPFEFLASG